MASATKTVRVRFDGDAKGLKRAAEQGEKSVSRMSRAMATAGKGFGAVGKGTGAVVGGLGKGVGILGLVAGATVGAGIAAIDYAGNLDLMNRKAGVVFGNQIGKVEAWAKKNANAMGLTTTQAKGLAAGFGDLLVPMGFTREQATKMSTDVIGLSGALAEWSGGQRTSSEVAEILSSAMLGETDALKGLGISISAADIEARLATKGQKELTGAARQQAEALAIQEMLFEKSTDAQKAFANGQDTLARKAATSKARLQEMADKLLVAAMPALTGLADMVVEHVLPALEKFVTWLIGPGKFQIADGFLSFTIAGLDFAESLIGWLNDTSRTMFKWADNILGAMEGALGWHPLWKGVLKDARSNFDRFRSGVEGSLDEAQSSVSSWNSAARNMRDEVRLQANISQLESKLATAKEELADPNLTKTRRAKVNADIAKLKRELAEAKRLLDGIPDETVVVNYVGRSTSGQNRRMPPGLATGGPARRGWTGWVGEGGPELVTFGTNARVHSAEESRAMVAASLAMKGDGAAAPIIVENHIEIGGEVVRVVRTEIRENDKALKRRVTAGVGGAR